MSREESACCRAMQDKCGAMATMGCCRTETQTDEHPQIATKPAMDPHVDVVHAFVGVIAAQRVFASYSFATPREYSPPGLLTASTTVLRI